VLKQPALNSHLAHSWRWRWQSTSTLGASLAKCLCQGTPVTVEHLLVVHQQRRKAGHFVLVLHEILVRSLEQTGALRSTRASLQLRRVELLLGGAGAGPVTGGPVRFVHASQEVHVPAGLGQLLEAAEDESLRGAAVLLIHAAGLTVGPFTPAESLKSTALAMQSLCWSCFSVAPKCLHAPHSPAKKYSNVGADAATKAQEATTTARTILEGYTLRKG